MRTKILSEDSEGSPSDYIPSCELGVVFITDLLDALAKKEAGDSTEWDALSRWRSTGSCIPPWTRVGDAVMRFHTTTKIKRDHMTQR